VTAVNPEASRQAAVEAALVLLERMGLTPDDLTAVPQPRKSVPTFAEYVPVVAAAVSNGTCRAYGSYWNRVVEHWGSRRLDEPAGPDRCEGGCRTQRLRRVPRLPAHAAPLFARIRCPLDDRDWDAGLASSEG
jgi:hypothetical protein